MDLAKIPKTRQAAKDLGATHYFTGKPCKHGHIAPRLVKGTCVECRKVEWQVENERRKGLPKSEAARAAGRRYYEKNKELVKAKANTRTVIAKRESRRKWAEANKDKRKLYTNTRRRRLRDATPVWSTPEDKLAIREVYKKCAKLSEETGTRYVVDHIIPLQAPMVCGLHVLDNLQIIPHSVNVAKGNKF